MALTLYELIPREERPGNDVLLGRFLDYAQGRGLTLYPAQETAILELYEEKNVILNTPTGSGKSLVAAALHFQALAQGRRSVYTCPIKALVNEKWMALCRDFGAENVGLSTGDASVNRDAPIVCCTAEILANIALREGAQADVRDVVMDEFHYYADRERGVAWQAPLLTLPQARFLLMSATLGDTTFFEEELTRLNGRPTVAVASDGPAGAAGIRLLGTGAGARRWRAWWPRAKARSTWCISRNWRRRRARRISPASTSVRARKRTPSRSAHRRIQVHQPVRTGHQEMAAARHRAASRRAAAEVSACWWSNWRKRAC